MAINIKNQKEEKRVALLRAYGLPKTTRAIVVSYIHNPDIEAFLTLACTSLGIALFREKDEMILAGADAWISDVIDSSVPVDILTQNIIVPIIPTGDIRFSDFNPMKFEGNAFLFDKIDEYHVFASLIRYIENVRYPGDRGTLLKNLSETKI